MANGAGSSNLFLGREGLEQVPIVVPPETHRAVYMTTKREKLGHAIPESAIHGPITPSEATADNLQPDD